MKRSSDPFNQNQSSIAPPIVFCPICKSHPMAIKALQTAMLTKQIKITYFCAHCGAEIEEPIEH